MKFTQCFIDSILAYYLNWLNCCFQTVGKIFTTLFLKSQNNIQSLTPSVLKKNNLGGDMTPPRPDSLY